VVQIPVELNRASPNVVTVEYFLGGGTATGGVDYQFAPGLLTFAPGETSKLIELALFNDPYVEPGQTVILKLRYARGAALGTSTHTYTIQDGVAPFSFATLAGPYSGLIRPAQDTALTFARTGIFRTTVSKSGSFSGTAVLGGVRFAFSGSFDQTGVARFGRQKADFIRVRLPGQPEQVLRLQLDMALGSHKLNGQLTGQGNLSWSADRAVSSAPSLAGKYTVVFPAKTPAQQGLDSAQYPQGHGVGTLSVLTSGGVRLSGTLADGRAVSFSGALSKENTFAFYAPLASGKGALSGAVGFRETPGASDLDGQDLLWFNPFSAARKRYPAGWINGIRVDLLGSVYRVPAAGQSALPGLGAVGPEGNALLELSGGDLPPAGIQIPLNVTPAHTVRAVTPGPEALRLVIRPATGRWSGSFVHPVTRRRVPVSGVIFQKTSRGDGFLLGPSQSGPASLTPRSEG
jgi:hypothetical protein